VIWLKVDKGTNSRAFLTPDRHSRRDIITFVIILRDASA